MAKKLKDDLITADDLKEFVEENSDFAFEMRVLSQLQALGFNCDHAGTYIDPISGKSRQFDIRATKQSDKYTLALAVECKNVRPNCPILLNAVPRTGNEAFHHLILHEARNGYEPFSLRPLKSVYREGDFVAKSTDQVGRDNKGALTSNDETTFEKLSQAVNSCKDLTMPDFVPKRPQKAVVPIVLVPSESLWQVDYTAEGKLQTAPRKVDKSTLYYNHYYPIDAGTFPPTTLHFRISHVEFVTFDALSRVIGEYVGENGFFLSAA